MCKNCLFPGCTNEGFVKVQINDRGKEGHGYLCQHHAHRNEGYSDENNIRYGTVKANGFTYAKELETDASNMKARAELLHMAFMATNDCTCDTEYKSPIYEGLNAPSKQAISIEKLYTDGDLYSSNGCGTHFHVGHHNYINPVTMKYLRRFNHSLFIPLSEVVMADQQKATAFFGRANNHWAQPITLSDPSGDYEGWRMKHEAMINLQHDYTVEFRQPKFVTAKQYQQVMKFARDCTNTIIENFIKHFNDREFDRSRYATITEYRKHKADVTAGKLVALYNKYTKNI